MDGRSGHGLRFPSGRRSCADDYARLITLEMGKPLAEAVGEVKKAAFGARHFAAEGAAYIKPEAIAGTPGRVVYESLGPVLAIMPWNLPFWQVLRFFIPAALVGNTVVVKHAETVQGSALALEALVRGRPGRALRQCFCAARSGARDDRRRSHTRSDGYW
jgi:acyl-CoA reductase-like NAD-dependent aldehyde dehydrogenase